MTNSKIKLKNNQRISLYAHHSSPMKLVTGEIKPFRRMDISYKRKVNDKFSFTLKLKDVFDTGGFRITTNRDEEQLGNYFEDFPGTSNQVDYTMLNEDLIAEHRRGKRTLSLNIEYRFGAYEEKKYRREDSGHDHEEEGGGMQGGF